MFARGKRTKIPAAVPAGGGAGEVAVPVDKVDYKIEVRNVLARPPGPAGYGGAARERDDNIDDRATTEFIEQRKKWFHRPKPAGPSSAA